MTSVFDTRFASVGAPRLLEFNGESVEFVASGNSQSATAILERGPSQVEDGVDWRLLVEPCTASGLAATFSGAVTGDSLFIGEDVVPFDFQEHRSIDGAMASAHFERATLLQIGHVARTTENGDTTPTIAEDKLRRMVADSETFQGDGTGTLALQRVHRGGYAGPFVRPLACVWWEQYEGARNAQGAMDHSLPSGAVVLHMQYDGDADPADFFGGVIEDIRAQAGDDAPSGPYSESHLSLQSFSVGEVMQADKRFPHSLPFSICRAVWAWGDV